MYAAGGTEVRIFDLTAQQRDAARRYASEQAEELRSKLNLDAPCLGTVQAVEELAAAVRSAWMVIEAVPERLDLKRELLGELDRLADPDAILASNSSSLPTSQFIGNVQHRERVLNTHYQQPPDLPSVELMSDGETDEAIIDLLMRKLPQYGFVPFHVRRESDGLIFNRIWAAIKRECLMVVEEGVAPPEDVDRMWEIFTAAGVPPFRLMDRVGLDVVLDIEEHYAQVRPGLSEGPRTMLRNYIDEGRLGVRAAVASTTTQAEPGRMQKPRATHGNDRRRPGSPSAIRRRLLQVVADHMRLNAVPGAGHAGCRRASGPHPGMSIGLHHFGACHSAG
jgi:3-hydroxybutyryl-CoA dehydrogenase